MNARELRIGNFVLNDKCLNVIETLPSDVVCTLRTKQDNLIQARYELIEPIPLTEEWLLKFGFEKNEHSARCYTFKYIDLSMDFQPIDSELSEICNYKIEFVHQLQNLYFALTNEELL